MGEQIKEIQGKINMLRDKKTEIYNNCVRSGEHLSKKFWDLVKQIEWQEYLLWAAENGILE